MKYPVSLPLVSSSIQDRSNHLATLSHPSSAIWELEMHNGPDNRLTDEFILACLLKALDLVEKDWRQTPSAPGAIVISGSKKQQKFFSNGLDYENAAKDSGFFPNIFDPFIKRMFSFPLPIIAAINGHAFAGGFLIALACDYRVMTSGRAWCSMNELHFGAPLPQSVCAILNHRLHNHQTVRKTTLEGHRWTPRELLDIGVVDELADETEGVLEAAHRIAATRASLAQTGVFGLMKKDLMRRIFDGISLDNRLVPPKVAAQLALSRL